MVLAPEPDPWFISRSLDTMAFVLISRAERSPVRGDDALPMAARLIGAAESLRKRCGAGVIGPDIERNAAMTKRLRARLGDDAFAQAHSAGTPLSLDDVFALVRSLEASDATPVQATPPVRHRLDLRVLGRFEMSVDAVASSGDAVPVGKTRELLLFLLLHDGTTKDDVGLALWPDSSAAQVRNLFHVTLHHLRRLLGSARWIAFDHGRYRLARNPADDTQLTSDVDDVLATSARLRQALRRRETIDVTALDVAREVFERHRGELAPGFAAGDWLVAAQDRVRSAWVDGVDALARLYEVAGHVDGMIAACELLVAREPLREAAHRLLMEAYDRRGERARALSHYEGLAAMLGREVQARPSAETRALAERLKR
jgi:DNA-binding SARP family transcriptional activator